MCVWEWVCERHTVMLCVFWFPARLVCTWDSSSCVASSCLTLSSSSRKQRMETKTTSGEDLLHIYLWSNIPELTLRWLNNNRYSSESICIICFKALCGSVPGLHHHLQETDDHSCYERQGLCWIKKDKQTHNLHLWLRQFHLKQCDEAIFKSWHLTIFFFFQEKKKDKK